MSGLCSGQVASVRDGCDDLITCAGQPCCPIPFDAMAAIPDGPLADRARRALPAGLASLAGLACAACCILPLLLAGGVLSAAGLAAVIAWIPGLAMVLAALAGTALWWTRRRHRHRASCPGGTSCACGGS